MNARIRWIYQGISLLLLAVLCTVPALAQQRDTVSPCNVGRAEPPRVDPRNDLAICLPTLGVMKGLIDTTVKYNSSEEFGHIITPLGDIDGDSIEDFAVNHYRTDTVIGHLADEVLIYRGVRGGLPAVASGERLAPSERNAFTKILAVGDWDHDGFRDIAVRIHMYDDTSLGNVDGYDIARVVIFWNDGNGKYSLKDTTQLPCGADMWTSVCPGSGRDLDGDGIDDLLLWACGGSGFNRGGVVVGIPRLYIYRGRNHQRWGKEGQGSTADWVRWGLPPCGSIGVIDQDCDGALDIVFYDNIHAGTGHLSVLYGTPNDLPDTSKIESVDLALANGHYSMLEDVTGDHVPEIIVTCGSQELIKIWAGRSGMRLSEQFGTGDIQPPTSGWVARPWATIWTPRKINDYWNATGFDPVYDPGDVDLDGTGDVMVVSTPYLVCYLGGRRLDSLVDALVYAAPNPLYVSRVGNIDGSGKSTIAVFTTPNAVGWNPDPGSITFVQPTVDVPHEKYYRTLPPGTDAPCESTGAVVVPSELQLSVPGLSVAPNPVHGEMRLWWDATDDRSAGEMIISDESGREIEHQRVEAGATQAIWRTDGVARGVYLAVLRIGTRVATARLVVK